MPGPTLSLSAFCRVFSKAPQRHAVLIQSKSEFPKVEYVAELKEALHLCSTLEVLGKRDCVKN